MTAWLADHWMPLAARGGIVIACLLAYLWMRRYFKRVEAEMAELAKPRTIEVCSWCGSPADNADAAPRAGHADDCEWWLAYQRWCTKAPLGCADPLATRSPRPASDVVVPPAAGRGESVDAPDCEPAEASAEVFMRGRQAGIEESRCQTQIDSYQRGFADGQANPTASFESFHYHRGYEAGRAAAFDVPAGVAYERFLAAMAKEPKPSPAFKYKYTMHGSAMVCQPVQCCRSCGSTSHAACA